MPRRHGLFSTTALIPAIAALAGGAMMVAPGKAQAQTAVTSGAVANGFGDNTVCLDPSLDLCPIDLGANDDTAPVTVTSFATANAGRSLLIGGGENGAQAVNPDANGDYVFNGVLNSAGIVLNKPVTIFQATGPSSFQEGAITETGGARAIRKTGDATLFFSCSGPCQTNTYSGGTFVDAGVLTWNRDNAFGAAGTSVTIADGAGVRFTANSFSSDRPFNLTGGTAQLIVDSVITGQLTGLISGAGGLNKLGLGTLVLTGNSNSYQGGTSVTQGTLQVSSDGNLGAASGGVTFNGGTLSTTTSFATSRTFTLVSGAGGIAPGAGTALTLNGSVTGVGTLNHTGAGTLILAGKTNYSGGTFINSGTLEVRDGSSLGTGNVGNTGTLLFNNANAMTIGNLISGNGALTKTGAGTLTLAASSNYTGVTTVNAGTLVVGNAAALGTAGGGTTVSSGATLAVQGGLNSLADSITVTGTGVSNGGALRNLSGDNILTGSFGFGGATLITSDAGLLDLRGNMTGVNNTVTFDGAGSISLGGAIIFGLTGLTKTGSGTLILASGFNPSSYSGGLDLAQGTVSVRTNLGAGFGTIRTTGSVIDYVNGVTSAAPVVVDSNTTQLQVLSGTATLSGIISELNGPRPIEKIGAGQLNLTAANSYTGATTITAGTLSIGNGGTTGSIASNSIINNAALVFNRSDTLTYGGAISGSGTLTKNGSGTLNLTGSSSYAGTTTIANGMLQIGADGAGSTSGSLGTGQVVNNATLRFNRADDITVTNSLIGSGSLILTGAGTVTLTGTKSYTGATQINGGTLVLGGSTPYNGAGALTVNGGNLTLGVGATFASATQSNSTVSLGSQTLNLFSGNYTLNGGSISGTGTIDFNNSGLAVNINSASALIASGVTITSTLGFNSAVNVTVSSDFSLLPTIAGANTRLALSNNGGGTITVSGNNSFGGGTTLFGGTLAVASNTALGTGGLGLAGNAILVSSGTGDRSISNAISLNGSLISIGNPNAGTSFTLGGAIDGANGFAKTGAGTLILTGANTYSGGTTISAGTLQIGSGALGGSLGSGGVTVSSGATLRSDSSANITIAGALAGSGALVQAGSGRTSLNVAANGYSGTAQILAGTLELGTATSLGTGGIELRGGSLHLASGGSYSNAVQAFTADGNVVSTAASTTATLTGRFGGAGTLRLAPGTGSFLDIQPNALSVGVNSRIIVQSGTVRAQNTGLGTLLVQPTVLTQVDAGATLDFLNRATTITSLSGAGTILNAGNTTTLISANFSGAFNGAQSLVTTGAVTLSGNSGYTGTTTVQSGTLNITNAGALGTSASGTTVNSGGTLLITGSSPTLLLADALTISGTGNGGIGAVRVEPNASPGNQGVNLTGGVTLAADATITVTDRIALSFNTGGIALGSSTLTFASEGTGNSSTFVNSAISGTGGLTKTGAGVLNLNGTNTFTGPVNLNGGTLTLTGSTALANTVAVIQAAGTRLDVVNGEAIGSLAGAGIVTLGNGTVLTIGINNSSTTYTGNISGNGSLIKDGTGTFTLAGSNTFAGPLTTVMNGTLALQGGSALSDTQNIFIDAAGTLRLEAGETIGGIAGTGSIVLATTGPLVVNAEQNQSFGGIISQSGATGSFTKRGAATQTITAAQTFTGQTSVEAGILVLSGVGALASAAISTSAGGTLNTDGGALASNAVIGHSGILTLSGSETIGSISGSGAINLNNATLTTGNAGDATLSGIIAGTNGALVKTGTGTLTLSGANTYGGGTTINAGTLALNQVAGGIIGAAGSGQITIESDGNLLSNVTGTLANRFRITSSTNASIGAASGTTLTLTGDQFVTSAPLTLTFGSSTATGTIDLAMPSGVTIASGMRTTIAGGTVRTSNRFAADVFSFASGGTTIGTSAASAALDVNGLSFNLVNLGGNASGTLTNLGSQAATTTINSASASTFAGTITNGASALNLTKFGNATLTLTGSNSYSGITNILRGTLQIGEGGTTGTLGTGAVTLDALGNLTFNRSNDLVASNVISGAGTLTKLGAGTLSLTGANTLSGAVTITNGTLQIGDGGTSGSLGSGAVTNNATLAINLASDITLAQAITGTGALRKLGSGVATITSNLALGSATVEAGTLALSGTNSFTGGITVAGGTLRLLSANAAGGATGLIRTTGSVVDYADGIDMTTPIVLNSNTTQLQVLTGSATQSGVISEQDGVRPLEKIGAGTLTLSATNSYSGGTTISAGRLNITSNANLGAIAGGITIGNAVLGTTGLITSARAVSLTGAAGIDVSNSSLTLTGAVTGAGSLTKTGDGQLVLTANNSYAGTTTISGSGGLTVGMGGTTGTLGAGNITVNSGSFLAFSRSDAFTVANVISGQGNLGKQSSGTLTLSGANTFTGGLAIGAGTVALASTNAGVINAAGTGNITFSSNTMLRTDVSGSLGNNLFFGNGSSTVAAATGTTLRLASNVLSFEAGAGSPLNFGTASAPGTIELAPVSVLVGAQVNPININGGTLRLANAGAFTLLNGTNGVFVNGAALGADVAGTLTKVLTVGASGGTIDVAAASLTLQGANSYTGVLTKTGTGELRLTGAGTGSGTVQLNAGTLALLASNAGWGTGTLQMATGTTLRLGLPSPATLANNIVLGEGAGSTIIASSTNFSGVLSGGALTIASGLGADGPSVVRLTGSNTYGATTIGAGNTLLIGTVGNSGTLGTGNVTVNTGATLRFEGNSNSVANVISGAGRLVRDGLGTTTLTGANSYAGGTVISGGGIEIGHASALGSGGLTMSGTTSLTTLAGISASVTGLNIGNFANVSLSAASGQTLSLGGTLDFSNFATSLVFGTTTRTGTVAIGFAPATGPVSSASIRVDAGTLRLAAASDAFLLRAGGGLTVGSLGTLDLNGFAGGGVNLTGAGAITNSSMAGAQFEASQNAATTFTGTIGGGTGAISLVKSGTGALTLTGANSYTGTTSITGGSLEIGEGGTTGNLGTGNVSIAGGAQLLLNRSDALTLANVFSGAGTIQKNLGSTLTLTGSNTNESAFTGTVNVNGGTLLVNGILGDLTNRAATVNIASGAALGGAGTIQGNVVVANGGILSPGNSPATQTIAGNLTLSDSSVLNFELAQPGVVGGGINDLINVGGNLVLDGTLNVTALDGFSAGFYRLFNYGGTLTNNTLNLGTLPLGFTSSILTDIAGQVNILFNLGGQTVQYWDGTDLTGANATVNGDGGAGSWTSTATNWTNPTGFAVNSAWSGQAGVFAGAAGGAIGITGSQAFQELRFLTEGYVLSAADPTGGLATTGGFSIINVNSGISARVNAPITGTAGLTKSGSGTLTLAGANSYSGLTTVSGGTLSLLGGGTIAGAVQNNATLAHAGTINGLVTNNGTLTSTGTLAGGLTNNAGATANVAGALGGNAITNSGTLTFTGATTGIGAVTQNAGGVLTTASVATSFGSLAGTGSVVLGAGGLSVGSNNASTSFAGVLSGAGGLTKAGTGTFTLSGANSHTGLTSVGSGTLALSSGGTLAGAVQNNAAFTNAGAVAGLVTNTGTLVSTGTLSSGLVNNGGATANIAGTLTGAVTNSGAITLTGTTTGIGAVTSTGGTLNLAGFSTAIGSLSGTGAVELGAGTLTTGSDNASTTFSGVISGTGALTKTGTGTLTLSGANSFTGLTTVGQGSLSIDASGSLAGTALNNASLVNAGSIAGLVTNSGTLTSTGTLGGGLANNASATALVRGTINGPVSNSGTITLTGATSGNAAMTQTATGAFNLAGFGATIGSLAGSGAVQLGSGTLTLGGANTSTDFAGVISGSGALIKTGTATQTLSGANTFTGLTSINQGSIFLASGASLAGAVQNNATFINSGSVAGQVTNAGTLISAGTLAGGLVNAAGATASLANTVNGAITNSGTITLTAGLSGSPSFMQNTGASLNLAGFNATLGSIAGNGAIQLGAGALTTGGTNASTSFDGVISGSGTFNKAGTGTLTLGGSNTAEANFTGTVNVNAGALILNGRFGDVVANTANLSLASGATLGGSGSFLGNLSLGAGAILAPGNSPATINIGGNLLLDSASVLNFELAQAGVVGGGINDLINVGGNLTLDGTLNVAALTGFGQGIYRLINYGGTLTDNGLLLGTRPDGFTSSIITNVAGQVSVQFTLGVPTVLYWDGSDTMAASSAVNGNGGSGTWNSTSTNWTSAPGFSTAFPWNSQTGVFAGAAGGTVQVSGIQAFQQLRFETGGYVLNAAPGGGALATTGGTSIIDVSAGLGATVNTSIQGTAGLTKAGAGTLTLGGTNSYAGLTSIAAGTLALSSGGRIAGTVDNNATFTNAGTVTGQVTNRASLTSTGVLNGGLVNAAGATASLAGTVAGAVSNAGTIALTGATSMTGALTQTGGSFNLAGFNASVGSLAGSGSVQLGSGTLTIGGSLTTAFAGSISGTGNLVKTGLAQVMLSGANTFTGLTTVSAGALNIGTTGSLASAVLNNASLSNSGTISGLVTNSGNLFSPGALNGGLTNNAGATAIVISQLNGPVTNAGELNINGPIVSNSAVNQLSTGSLFVAPFISASFGSLSGSGTVGIGSTSLNNSTLTLGSNNASTSFTGTFFGGGNLVKTGTGILTLGGNIGHTGLTTVNAGGLVLAAGSTMAGAVQNNALFSNAGTIAGLVTNNTLLTSTGALNGGLVNTATGIANLSGVLNGAISNAGMVRLSGFTSGNVAFNQQGTGVFDLAGSSASIGSLAGSGSVQLSSGTLLLGRSNASTSFAGVISGSGGIEKQGTGTFTLTGANSFTGRALVSGGTLALASGASLAGSVTNNAVFTNAGTVTGGVINSGTLVSTGALNGGLVNNAGATASLSGAFSGNLINRGTVNLTGTTTGIGELSLSTGAIFNLGGFATTLGNLTGGGGTVALGSAALTLGSGTGSQTFDGTITGSGGLNKVSASTFSLSGAQSYTGLTTVNGGTFILGSNGSLAGAVLNNATVSSNGSIAGLVTNNGRLILTGTLAGGLVNAAGATANVRGTLAGSVANAGTITLTGAVTGIGAVTQEATGTFDLAGFGTSIGSLAGSGSVALGGGTLTTGGDNSSTTFAGVISGNGGIVKTGTGAFVLTGANSYAGLTTVSQGVLSVRNNAGLGSNAAGTTVDAGAALELQGGVTITGEALTINGTGVNGAGALRNVADNNIWGGTVTLGSDSLITADAGRLDIDLLAGTSQALTTGGAGLIGLANANTAGALTVTGGNLALFGSGNFAGGVIVNAGNLFLQGSSSVNDAAAVTLGTGNLIVAVSETIGSLAGAGGTVQIDAGQTLTLGGNDASTEFAGVIFNTGNLAKLGSGTFTVTGLLAHTGTTAITGGTLLSGAANIWQGNGLVTIGTGGTLDLGGFDQSIAAISLTGGTLANGALTGSISSSGGTIRDLTGAANALTANGGSTTLTGAGSFAQGVTLAGGDVVLQGAGASIADTALVTVNTGTLFVNVGETIGALAGSGGRVQIAQGQTLTTGGSNAGTAYAGVLAGNGALVKTGTGTFTLSGANTLTGAVTVNAGVLALATGGSLAGAVQNAAGFSNAGTVAGLATNTGTLISTGVLNGGLVNSGSAGLSGQLNGTVTNSGLIQLQGALTGIAGFSQTGTGTFDLAGFSTAIGSLSGAGNVLLGSATLTLGGSNASTSFGGTIGGTGGLTKVGTGGFTLNTGQAYTGLTTINGGLLTVSAGAGLSGSVLNNASFASSGLILGSLTNNGTATLAGQINGAVANNAVIALGGQLVVLGRLTQNAGGSLNLAGFNAGLGSLAGTGPIALGSGTLVVGSDNSSSLFSGMISGSGGLQKIGTGTFTLTGINSYTGLTLVNGGTLVIGEGASVGGTTSGIAATVAAPSVLAAPVANTASTPIAAEQASMPAAVTSLAAEQASMPAAVTALAAETASTLSASLASRAGMMVDNGSISGGPTPASLTSSGVRLPLAGGVSSGPERVDLFGDPASGAVSADLPVVTLGEASQTLAATAAITATAPAVGSLGLVSDLSNGMGAARLDGALFGGAESASPVAASLVDPLAPVASAGETPLAGPLSTAVIAGSVLNNANLINNGSILGQLINSAGAIAINNGVIRGLVTNAGTFTSTGTLSGGLSNSGTARISGTLTGDVLNSGSITLTGITSGLAMFQQAATGSLNLAGFDTTLGVLSGAGTITLGSARLTTGTNGVNSLYSGVISGTGALTKTGTGGLILDGENIYTGGTTIAGGTLQLGNGGTTGSIIGPVLNNGTLIVNRSNAYTFAGVISGTGAFVKAGTGTTTLTGANSYSGGTLISAGRLIGSTVSLQGLIQNDAALEFAQAANGVFAGRIGGTGLLDKSGAGLLELTGDNSALRGATTVRAGELRVTGSLAGSAATVLSGATLSGTGTVGGLVARSGSVVSPGAGGLGMLGVNGAIQLQQGSTLRLQIQAPSGSDMLIGNGTMQLGGTAALTNLGGTYAFNSNYLLLQASGGRTGTFDAVTGFGEFGILYRPELVYTANQVLLRMAPNLLANILGNTPLTANQRSVVSRIDAAVTAGYNPQPLFNVYALPNAQQPNAFDQLSGEVYATMAGVGIEQERLVREAVLGRINTVAATARQTPEWGNGAGAWGQVFGTWGDGERDGNAARYESDRQGFITGIDYGNANSEGSWRIGAFGVHMTSKVSVDARGSRAEVEQTGGGLYAGVHSGGVSVGMGASVTGVDLTAVRNIALPGFAETNRGRGDGRAVQGFAELSYAIEAGNATYRPFASVAVGEFKLDALTETGGAAALSVRRQSYRSGSVTVGADGTVRMGRVNLSGTLAGRFQVGDRDPAAQIALAAAPAQAFTIRGVQLDSFALAARLDATVKLTDGADLSLGYTGLIGKDTADHGARATLSVRF
ncbi:autotransporter-associated beta strand repeat-containing protein [Blastomonas sp.]|uniref:autotransporter-associated beta strand repeat-containing protein n=1 Tax=Blastomonas sp. TaxID=1909299 RepID=UPI00406A9DF5